MKVSPAFCFLLALMVLLHHPVAAFNWQGTGSLTDSTISEIWSYIDSNFKTYSDIGALPTFCTELSTLLNTKWDPAWNVVVVSINYIITEGNDAILYGYAFNSRWLWYNGYIHPQITNHMFSFVIWKDYNCQNWKSIGAKATPANKNSGFTSEQQMKIGELIGTYFMKAAITTDPWGQAKLFMDALHADSNFVVGNNHAYSIVLTQSYEYTVMHGRVCVVSNKFFYSPADYMTQLYRSPQTGNYYGELMLIQTR